MRVTHVAHTGEKRHPYRILVGKPRERDHFQNPSVDGTVKGKQTFFSPCPRHEGIWGSTVTGPLIPKLGSRWTHVVFTSRLLYPQKQIPVSTEQEAGWTQDCLNILHKGIISWPYRIEAGTVHPVAHSLYCLRYAMYIWNNNNNNNKCD